jgi:soluble lytic murein transglycosylase-like protein
LVRKLKTERIILIILLLTSLVFHVIFGLESKRQIAVLENEVFLNEININGLASSKAFYENLHYELSSRINHYKEREEQLKALPKIYDIPLSESLQVFTYYLCKQNDLNYELVLAIMEQESDYRETVISKTNDYGIMQINAVNHDWLSEVLDINDFLDAEQNIKAGIYILKDLTTRYEDPHQVLMAYNMGEYGAQAQWSQGILTSEYSRQVVERTDELREVANE